jgi:dipeptidyl aminopeptidase/acylaminoacyl peptidase
MNRILFSGLCFAALTVNGQQPGTVAVPESMLTEGLPAIPSVIAAEVKDYTEFRNAGIVSWHPLHREMLISTRFANSNQLHEVKVPGGMRRQLTFFDEPVFGATYEPNKGEYFVFARDSGGNEFTQLYRYDVKDRKVTLLTDGKRSQNGSVEWNKKGDLVAYSSTRRNGKDRDIYLMDPLDSSTDRMASENDGGGWGVAAWSPDGTQLLLQEGISVNESRLYLLDLGSRKKSRILPLQDERTTFRGVGFTADGKSIYIVTNQGSEFNRLGVYHLAQKKLSILTEAIPWDVDNARLSKDRSRLAFVTNENGLSRLYILNTGNQKYTAVSGVPQGVIGGLDWHANSLTLGFTLGGYNSAGDVYEYDVKTAKIIRWTESETGGMNPASLREPELISWTTFDGKVISGYLYWASPGFNGPRPVIISIHGGPEAQARPVFQGRWNYFLDELGVSLLFPNVRGSSGYGKTFLDLDNGMQREASVKDIGALLDWIGKRPDFDKERIMVAGGSYGGYMSLAVSFHYSDRIRCSLDNVGISNFNTFMKNTEAYRRDLRRVEYGDERDPAVAEFFEKIAPLNHADKIRKPIFIIQGGNDPRVPASEAMQMKDKIKAGGGTVWFLMAKDEGHGFRKKINVDYQFYATVAFVKKYLLN